MSEENKKEELPLGLYWKGKRTTVDRTVLPFQSLEVVETINESRATREAEKGSMFREPNSEYLASKDVGWRNKLIWGDNKYAMSALLEKYAGQINLIYIDPPFATGANFSTTVNIGEDDIDHTKEASAIEELAYRDTWGKGLDSFLQMMFERLVLMRELLTEDGFLCVHIDFRVDSYLRVLLDEVFGTENLRNHIIWHYPGREKLSSKKFQSKHDSIFIYAKTDSSTMNPVTKEWSREDRIKALRRKIHKDKDGREWFWETRGQASGVEPYKRYLDEYVAKGGALNDVWSDIQFLRGNHPERVGYDTQKPEQLLERFVEALSNERDLVADFFCGSGTTGAVAEKLGRRWIMSDLGRFAIHTTRKRMLEIEGCKPFEILNIGKYERQSWQVVSFGSKTREQTLAEYIAFILQLYKANSLPGSTFIHGQRGPELVHVGSVEAPVTLLDIQKAIEETLHMKQKHLTILGWEWEMGLHDVVEAEAKKSGVKLTLLNIPREAMDKRAVDAGDVQFFELAYLEVGVEQDQRWGYKVKLDDFVIPNLDLVPKKVRDKVKKWSDYIDYWSVDWKYQGDTFHNMWQAYRTKKDRKLVLETDPYQYTEKGNYKIMVKVIDIFGNDTTHIMELEVK